MAAMQVHSNSLLVAVVVYLAIAAASDTANCSRVTLCNGVMCDAVCKPGTVQLDQFTSHALAFQRELQREEPLVRTTLIGTHNSAISQAYGFGIEQDFIALLTGETMYTGDDLGEGVCQSLSVLDQLRLGLRHIEIDINSGWDQGHLDETFVCHSPFPLDPGQQLKIEAAAFKKGIKLGWDPKKLSCLGTNVPFRSMLQEIQSWLEQNPDEIVVLYLDVKPGCVALPAQTSSAFADMRAVFNDSIWAVADGDPLAASRAEFLARGKRVLFEDHSDGWKKPKHGEPLLVFTPDLWSHQFGMASVTSYPECSIEGEAMKSWYAPIGYNGTGVKKYQWVRGLGFGRATQGDNVSDTLGCAVNILSSNYVQPADLRAYVWSVSEEHWGAGEARGCMAMLHSGEWGLVGEGRCAENRPVACRAKADDTEWVLGHGLGERPCPRGYVPAVPTNAYANKRLQHKSELSRLLGAHVYLPVLPNGTHVQYWPS